MAKKIGFKLILSSASPRRKMLLKELGIPFTIQASNVPEDSKETHPRKLVEELALRKAQATAKTLKNGWVLGADTVVVLDGKILGKPVDAKDAYRMLYRLSGSTHSVYTGVALVEAGGKRQWIDHGVSIVRMKKMELDLIMKLSRLHMDKAGSYAIQEKKDPVAKVVKGGYDNVVGLPLDIVKKLLRKAGFSK